MVKQALLLVAVVAAAGCFDKPGEPLFHDGGGGGGGGGDGMFLDAPVDATTGAIRWVNTFCTGSGLGSAATSCPQPLGAANAGDAVLVQVGCLLANQTPTFSVTAPGWTFTELTPVAVNARAVYAAAFIAIAPDTQPVTLTATASTCVSPHHTTIMADEFANNDPTGTMVVDVNTASSGNGNGMLSVTTTSSYDALWAAVKVNGCVLPQLPFSQGTPFGGDDTEFAVPLHAPGVETAPFHVDSTSAQCSGTGDWAATMVAIKWRGP